MSRTAEDFNKISQSLLLRRMRRQEIIIAMITIAVPTIVPAKMVGEIWIFDGIDGVGLEVKDEMVMVGRVIVPVSGLNGEYVSDDKKAYSPLLLTNLRSRVE
jgi:hypothetical protein